MWSRKFLNLLAACSIVIFQIEKKNVVVWDNLDNFVIESPGGFKKTSLIST
jgi:hypothetical protein